MVGSCCVLGCSNKKKPGSRILLYRIPKEPLHRRQLWLKAINRTYKKGPTKGSLMLWEPTAHQRVCCDHFITGRPIHKAGHPDYVPNKKLWCEIEGRYFSVDHSFGESREETSLKSDENQFTVTGPGLQCHLRSPDQDSAGGSACDATPDLELQDSHVKEESEEDDWQYYRNDGDWSEGLEEGSNFDHLRHEQKSDICTSSADFHTSSEEEKPDIETLSAVIDTFQDKKPDIETLSMVIDTSSQEEKPDIETLSRVIDTYSQEEKPDIETLSRVIDTYSQEEKPDIETLSRVIDTYSQEEKPDIETLSRVIDTYSQEEKPDIETLSRVIDTYSQEEKSDINNLPSVEIPSMNILAHGVKTDVKTSACGEGNVQEIFLCKESETKSLSDLIPNFDILLSDKALDDRSPCDKELDDRSISDNELNDRSISDKALNDRSISDKELYDRSVSDKELNDRSVSDKELNDRSVSDKELNDRSISDKELYDRSVSDKELYDRSISDKELNDRSISDKELYDRSIIDKELNDRYVSDKELNDRFISDKELNKRSNSSPSLSSESEIKTCAIQDLHTCSMCNQSFTKILHLKIHRMISQCFHSSFKCEVCGKRCSTSQDLLQHNLTHLRGNQDKGFECNVCGKMCISRQGLLNHNLIHDQDSQGKGYGRTKSLAAKEPFGNHTVKLSGQNIHEIKMFICNVCGIKKRCRSQFEVHMRQHTGEKPEKCEVCGKCFTSKIRLKFHMKVHSADKPYICQVCGFACKRKVYLPIHMKRHSEEKTFLCVHCGKGFKYWASLHNHEKSHACKSPLKGMDS